MQIDDIVHYSSRLTEEVARAERSSDPSIAATHHCLAELCPEHLDRLGQPRGEDREIDEPRLDGMSC